MTKKIICACGSRDCTASLKRGDGISASNRRAARYESKAAYRAAKRTEKRASIREQLMDMDF